jgi:hypothetical protein
VGGLDGADGAAAGRPAAARVERRQGGGVDLADAGVRREARRRLARADGVQPEEVERAGADRGRRGPRPRAPVRVEQRVGDRRGAGVGAVGAPDAARRASSRRAAAATRPISRAEYGRWPTTPPATGTSPRSWSTSPVAGSCTAAVAAAMAIPPSAAPCASRRAAASAPAASARAAAAATARARRARGSASAARPGDGGRRAGVGRTGLGMRRRGRVGNGAAPARGGGTVPPPRRGRRVPLR